MSGFFKPRVFLFAAVLALGEAVGAWRNYDPIESLAWALLFAVIAALLDFRESRADARGNDPQ